MTLEFKKRLTTSFFLILLLILMINYSFILIISVIIIAIISWVEFYALISKIIIFDNFKSKLLRFLYKTSFLIYILSLVFFILFIHSNKPELEILIIYSILVSILSDIGGLIIGKKFKGKKLTKISPNKTISGALGSFIFSLFLIPFFVQNYLNHNLVLLILITIIISITSQVGDICISFLKRKAKVKDTSDLLPGHGGFLDRIDGIIFSIPIGFMLLNYFN